MFWNVYQILRLQVDIDHGSCKEFPEFTVNKKKYTCGVGARGIRLIKYEFWEPWECDSASSAEKKE